jgi:hypothetical protein
MQAVAAVAPTAAETLPTGQPMQAAAEDEPVAALYLPAGQS